MLSVQRIPENGQETPKRVGGLPPVITVNNYIAVSGIYVYGMRLDTWNVRSLYRSGSLTTVARYLANYKLDLLGV